MNIYRIHTFFAMVIVISLLPGCAMLTNLTMGKAKGPADLEIVKGSTIVRMGVLKKDKTCKVQVDSKVKNIGGKVSDKSTLHFSKNDAEFKTFKILTLKSREASKGKRWIDKKLAEGDYKWTFTVDAVSGETNKANNTHSFVCNCGLKKKQICKKKK